MENENMKLEILSINCAGWGWKLSDLCWHQRLSDICSYIKKRCENPFAVALQEVQLSGGKYIATIRDFFPESEYFFVLPKAWNSQPKSVVSLLLLNKRYCESYSLMTLPELEESLRYNFVTVNTYTEGLCFRILNTNVPHISFDMSKTASWYYDSRVALRNKFTEAILNVAKTYDHEPDLKFICLGDMNSTPNDPFIKALAYDFERPMLDATKKVDIDKPTWTNEYLGTKNRIDYILYSNGMLNNTGVAANITIVDKNTIHSKYSDHALLVGGITLDMAIWGALMNRSQYLETLSMN